MPRGGLVLLRSTRLRVVTSVCYYIVQLNRQVMGRWKKNLEDFLLYFLLLYSEQ